TGLLDASLAAVWTASPFVTCPAAGDEISKLRFAEPAFISRNLHSQANASIEPSAVSSWLPMPQRTRAREKDGAIPTVQDGNLAIAKIGPARRTRMKPRR